MNVRTTVTRWVLAVTLVAGIAFAQTAAPDFQGPELEQFLSQAKMIREKILPGVDTGVQGQTGDAG